MTVEMRTGRRGKDGSTLARVRSVARAVAILRCFSPGRMYLTLGEIAATAGLDAGTARRLLVTLRDEGLIVQAGDGRYHLALQMMRFAAAVPEGRSLRDLAADDLRALATETGLTVILSVLRDKQAICIAREHGDSPIQVRWWPVGEAMPLNCGAAPKLLFAHMSEADRQEALSAPLVALTRHSMTNPMALDQALASVRAQGWSLSTDDVAEGLSALAAPVHTGAGAVAGAVSVAGLTASVVEAGGGPCSEVLAALVAACARISGRLI